MTPPPRLVNYFKIRNMRACRGQDSESCPRMLVDMAKLGRRTKGDRDTLIVRVMRPMGDQVRQNADHLGISITDYVTTILARELNMPEHAPVLPAVDQLTLPLDRRMTA